MSQFMNENVKKGTQQQEQEDGYDGIKEIQEDHDAKDSGKNRCLQEYPKATPGLQGKPYPLPNWKKISVAPYP